MPATVALLWPPVDMPVAVIYKDWLSPCMPSTAALLLLRQDAHNQNTNMAICLQKTFPFNTPPWPLGLWQTVIALLYRSLSQDRTSQKTQSVLFRFGERQAPDLTIVDAERKQWANLPRTVQLRKHYADWRGKPAAQKWEKK